MSTDVGDSAAGCGSGGTSRPTSWWWPARARARRRHWWVASWLGADRCGPVERDRRHHLHRGRGGRAARADPPRPGRGRAAGGDERMIVGRRAKSTTPPSARCTPSPNASCSSSTSTPASRRVSRSSTTPPITADFDARSTRFADACSTTPRPSTRLVARLHRWVCGPRDLAAVAWNLHGHWDRLEDGGLDYLRVRAGVRRGQWPSTDPGARHRRARRRPGLRRLVHGRRGQDGPPSAGHRE